MAEFKIGYKVKCIPGFQGTDSFASEYGGNGYVENKEFIIEKITGNKEKNDIVIWPQGKGGIFPKALRLVDNKTYKKLKLNL